MSQKVDYVGILKDIYNATIESGTSLTDQLDNIDFYGALCKSIGLDRLYKIYNCNVIAFNYRYKDDDCVIFIFGVPSQSNLDAKDDGRHISQKVMDILKTIEKTFIRVEYMDFKDVKEDKFCYLTTVIKIGEF
jgi:hypothetical protein